MDLFTLAYIKNMTKGIHTEDCEGIPGKSAYEIAVENGFVGTEQDWLNYIYINPEDQWISLDDMVAANQSENK